MPDDRDDFLAAASRRRPGFVRELLEFLRQNKKWWLTPIAVAVLLLGVLVTLAGTGAAPFVYTLF
jgi:hypothetical protein